jgi:hypothetical protein
LLQEVLLILHLFKQREASARGYGAELDVLIGMIFNVGR